MSAPAGPGRFANAEALELAHGSHLAVAASTFDIPAGVTTAIIGPNGSGKSTVLHALAGLLRARSGSLTLRNADGSAPRISYVMQRVDLPEGVPLTVREVVAMGRYPALGWWRRRSRADREAVRAAMAELEITDLAARHLHELSGGQRQRVFVAQGIAQDHDALLLDEPLTGLDLPSARIIDRIVHDHAAQRRTIVMTTHDLAEARASDHVVLLAGQVIASGPPALVCRRENLERAYGLGALHDEIPEILDDPQRCD